MDLQRFEALAEAYGGDLARWPAAERAAAIAYRAAEPEAAAAVLAQAEALDSLLGAAPEPVLSGVMHERLIASAPKPARPIWLQGRTWASGMGLAAACAAGVVFGATFFGQGAYSDDQDVLNQAATSFDAAWEIAGVEEVG